MPKVLAAQCSSTMYPAVPRRPNLAGTGEAVARKLERVPKAIIDLAEMENRDGAANRWHIGL